MDFGTFLNTAWRPNIHAKRGISHSGLKAMDIHALAKQMGTSIGMIERHYSHLTPRMKKDMFTGKRYELSRDEFDKTD